MLLTILVLALASLLAAATPVDTAPRAVRTYTSYIHPASRRDLCVRTTSQYYGGYVGLDIKPEGGYLLPVRFVFNEGKTRIKHEHYNYCVRAQVGWDGNWSYKGDGSGVELGICPPAEKGDVPGFEWQFVGGKFEQLYTRQYRGGPYQCLDNWNGAYTYLQTWTCFAGNQNQQWVAD